MKRNVPLSGMGLDYRWGCENQSDRATVVTALAAAVVALWLLPLGFSLWLDETVTFWIIRAEFAGILQRSLRFQGSPTYFFIPWLATKLAGDSELVLRLPSVAATALSTLLVYRIGIRLLDREAAVIAAVVFAASEHVVLAGVSARPYAFALLATLSAMLFLLRWEKSSYLREGVAYAVSASLAVYFQVLFGAMFLVHGIYLVHRRSNGGRLSYAEMFKVALLVLLFLTPFVPQLSSLSSRAGGLSWAPEPSLSLLLLVIAPPGTSWGIAAGIVLARIACSGFLIKPPRITSNTLILLACWFAVPAAVIFAISVLTPSNLFWPRYLLCVVPVPAFLIASVIRSFEPRAVRHVIVASYVFASILYLNGRVHTEDWRGAAAAARSLITDDSVPVFVRSGLVEAAQPQWLNDPDRQSYLLAPMSYYSVNTATIALPYTPTIPETQPYLEQLLATTVAQVDRFVLISRFDVGFQQWLESRSYASRTIS